MFRVGGQADQRLVVAMPLCHLEGRRDLIVRDCNQSSAMISDVNCELGRIKNLAPRTWMICGRIV